MLEANTLGSGKPSNYVLGRGLEPHFRVLLSAIFHGFPWGTSIRVEICGK